MKSAYWQDSSEQVLVDGYEAGDDDGESEGGEEEQNEEDDEEVEEPDSEEERDVFLENEGDKDQIAFTELEDSEPTPRDEELLRFFSGLEEVLHALQ